MMSYRITFLGVGGAFNHTLGNSNVLIDWIEDEIIIYRMLIDCGTTALNRLHHSAVANNADYNSKAFGVDAVLLTHLHSDHHGGLEELGFRNKHLHNGFKPMLFLLPGLAEDLWNGCLKGSMGYSISITGATEKNELDSFFDVIESQTIVVGPEDRNILVSLVPVQHVPGQLACGLFLNILTNTVWFSGDCVYSSSLNGYLEQSDVIFHEVQRFDLGAANVHTPLATLNSLSPELKKRIHLYHYDSIEEKEISGFGGIVKPMDFFIFKDSSGND